MKTANQQTGSQIRGTFAAALLIKTALAQRGAFAAVLLSAVCGRAAKHAPLLSHALPRAGSTCGTSYSKLTYYSPHTDSLGGCAGKPSRHVCPLQRHPRVAAAGALPTPAAGPLKGGLNEGSGPLKGGLNEG